jgi:hypothetical protein
VGKPTIHFDRYNVLGHLTDFKAKTIFENIYYIHASTAPDMYLAGEIPSIFSSVPNVERIVFVNKTKRFVDLDCEYMRVDFCKNNSHIVYYIWKTYPKISLSTVVDSTTSTNGPSPSVYRLPRWFSGRRIW